MTLPTAAKIAGGAAGVVGIPTSIYFAHNYATSLYEVENKVLDSSVYLSVQDKNSSGTGTPASWTIKVNTSATTSADGVTWSETDGYYWECVISGKTELTQVTKTALENKLPKDSSSSGEDKQKNKKKLVEECSKNRTEGSHKKVKAKFDFPDGVSDSNWETYLFGPTTA